MIDYKGSIQIYYPDTVNSLGKAPLANKIRKVLLGILVVIIGAGLLVGIGYAVGENWLMIAGYVLGGLSLVGGVGSALTSKFSNCVYCGAELGKTLDGTLAKDDENKQIECEKCWEWLISHKGSIRAFTQNDAYDMDVAMHAPVFVNGGWQDECAVCGDTTAKHEQAKKSKMSAEQILVGSLSANRALAGNIPYCSEHSDSIGLQHEDEYLKVVFPYTDMMKRYLIFNAGRMEKRVKLESRLEKFAKS
jgi:hypothetical protein